MDAVETIHLEENHGTPLERRSSRRSRDFAVGIPALDLIQLLDANALNLRPFFALGANCDYTTGRDEEFLIAVPNLFRGVNQGTVYPSNSARGPEGIDTNS